MSVGKIYKLICEETGDIYIGSTIKKYLSQRKSGHKYLANKCVCKNFINPIIELIEELKYDNIEELRNREGEIIRNTNCINKQIPGRTYKEWAEDTGYYKKRYAKEKEISKKRSSEYYQKNSEKIKERAIEKIECEVCEKKISRCNMSRHIKNMHGEKR